MEVSAPYVFQTDHAIVRDAYLTKDNYHVSFNEVDNVQQNLCVVYFSSNEVYYPNTETAFKRAIIENDKYEWRNNTLSYAYKHVFIRDIQKQWYMEGINNEINTPVELLKLLQSLTAGLRVYTVGSSAGGFAAMLFGNLLKAERVYAFNSQLNLNIVMKNSTPSIDPILFKYACIPTRVGYYKIEDFINREVECFYFQSSKSSMDIEQWESFGRKEVINRIAFKTSNHGFPFLRHNLQYVMSLSPDLLKNMARRENNPFAFAVSIDGLFKTIVVVGKAIFGRVRKKMKEKSES